MNSGKKGFSILDVIFGFVILMIIISFILPAMTSSFINIRKGRVITEGVFEGAKYLQDEMSIIRKKINNNEPITLNPETLNKKTFTLFTGLNKTFVEVYVIKLPDDNKAKNELNRDYTLFVASKPLEDLPIVKVKKVENYIQNILTDNKYQTKVNYYKDNLSIKGDMSIDEVNSKAKSAGANSEKKYWQIAPENFIIPIYTDVMDSTKYENHLLGKAFPVPRQDTKQEVAPAPSNQLLISSDKYANKVLYYTVRTLSEQGKLGPYEWPKGEEYGGGIYLLKYPTNNTPILHLEANYITPDNYEQLDNGFIIKNVNKPITTNTANKSGDIELTTEQSGKMKLADNFEREVWTRTFNFNGEINKFIQDDLGNITNITVFVVAKLKDEPNNNIPIISFENNMSDYRFRLTSKNLYLKSNIANPEKIITMSTVSEKGKYAVYTIKMRQEGNCSIKINGSAEVELLDKLEPLSLYNGKIRLGSFMNNSYGEVNIAQVMVYTDEDLAQLGSENSSKIIDFLMKKYGISNS